MHIADSRQIRLADEMMINEEKSTGLLLMETAGSKSAKFILGKFPSHTSFLILAGPGNNGGDGFVIARHLKAAGKNPVILFANDPGNYKGDALHNYLALQGLDIPAAQWGSETCEQLLSTLPEATLVIDALLGTGVKDKLKSPFTEIIAYFSARPFEAVAIDLPSGLSADTGALVNRPLKAKYTLSFHCLKICHCVMPAAESCGEIIVVDIGITPEITDRLGIHRRLITAAHIRKWHKTRVANVHKGSFGHVLSAGGSRNMAGAISLTSRAALHLGAGLSTAFIPGAVRCAFYQQGAEVMTLPAGDDSQPHFMEKDADAFLKAGEGKNVIALGPGMGIDTETAAFLEAVLKHIRIPLILDADALNLLASHPEWMKLLPANTLLTPHPGELQRLMPAMKVNEFRLEAAEQFAAEHRLILVLKGAGTIIALPDGNTWVNATGNPGMATAGSGDVLTGAIAALLAQGYAPEIAILMAVFLHGAAGDLAAAQFSAEGVTAGRILEQLGPALKAALEMHLNEPQSI